MKTVKHKDVLVILPAIPGDLVCCRYALTLLCDLYEVSVICRERHIGLLQSLSVRVISISDYSIFQSMNLETLSLKSDLDKIIDLHNSIETHRFCAESGVFTVGQNEFDVGLVYDKSFKWWLNPGEKTHASVRHVRSLDGHEDQSEFDAIAWRRSHYQVDSKVEDRLVGLCPGSSTLGLAKRIKPEHWSQVASYLRARDIRICWFLGPDEQDLEPLLVKSLDILEGGAFEDVVKQHSRCRYVMTHDTVHLHIHAHMPNETAAIFVRGEAREWGGYPEGVSIIDFSTDVDPNRAAHYMINWFSSRLS